MSTVYGTILSAWTIAAFLMEITLLKRVILTQKTPQALGNHTINIHGHSAESFAGLFPSIHPSEVALLQEITDGPPSFHILYRSRDQP